jgi:hypothetical protein
VIPQKTLDQIGKVNKGFAEAKQAVDAFKSATTAATPLPRSTRRWTT